jgi:hypothetical protein
VHTRRSFLASGIAATVATTFDLSRPLQAIGTRASRAAHAAQFEVGGPPLGAAAYWAFADWLQPAMDRLWNPAESAYTHDIRINASALVAHAGAAVGGHQGECRQDERARQLVHRLCQSPPYRPTPAGGPTRHPYPRSANQNHAPGFVSDIAEPDSDQHFTVDPQVARALYYAWLARHELALPPTTVASLVARVRSVAYSPFYRYPNIRLNQINFAAELYACAASMTDDSTLLRRDYRKQLTRFLDGATRKVRPWRIPNLGPSYNFHRNPFRRASNRQNIESAEYANIVLDVIYYYEQARRAGMTPLSTRQAGILRAWVARALPAYWTHGGYLNWDTGLYLYRWHLSRYWAWACRGLLAIASSQSFVDDDHRRWAKYIFDRSLALYARQSAHSEDDGREPGSALYGITTRFDHARHFELGRFQALAAEAVLRGLGDQASEQPPSMYCFDPSIGRLAVTTPHYNTAIVPASNGSFAYGGIELARLYDGSQRVVSHIGGSAPAGLGLIVRTRSGAIAAASQRVSRRLRPGRRPIRLVRSPAGPVRRGRRYPRRPYAGGFAELEAEGRAERDGVRFTSHYRFTADAIEIRWKVTRARTDPLFAEALLPSWGAAVLNVALKNGEEVRLGNPPDLASVELAAVRWFYIDSGRTESGYLAVPRGRPPAAFAYVLPVAAQYSNPQPGRSIALRLTPGSKWSEITFGIAIAPARTLEEAEAAAARLGA